MVLNNKIHFEILPDQLQPQKTIFSPNADMIKKAKVLDIGNKVEFVKKGDIIDLYVTTMFMTGKNEGFCAERDVVFANEKPQPGKIHVKYQKKDNMESLHNAEVVNASVDDVDIGDKIYYRSGQSHILPDHTEIISETQVYYK